MRRSRFPTVPTFACMKQALTGKKERPVPCWVPACFWGRLFRPLSTSYHGYLHGCKLLARARLAVVIHQRGFPFVAFCVSFDPLV